MGARHLGLLVLLLASSLASPAALGATTVYVNRCVGGCSFTPGPDNSVLNTSSIVAQTRNLSEFAHGTQSFDAVVSCVSRILRPFDILVTTTDPSPSAHHEIALAGLPTEAGLPNGVHAVAPFTCGYIPNSPFFAFANAIGNDVDQMCWAAASQVGAVAGVEPLFNCPDVMSYLQGCGDKSFRDEASSCGTFSATTCMCGGTTRNSYAVMRAVFGAGDSVFEDGFE